MTCTDPHVAACTKCCPQRRGADLPRARRGRLRCGIRVHRLQERLGDGLGVCVMTCVDRIMSGVMHRCGTCDGRFVGRESIARMERL
jgi:hypothetical protein